MFKILSVLFLFCTGAVAMEAYQALSQDSGGSTKAPTCLVELTEKQEQDIDNCVQVFASEKKDSIKRKLTTFFKHQYQILYLNNFGITGEYFEGGVVPFLQKNPKIEYVSLNYNAIRIIGQRNFKLTLKTLKINNNGITAQHVDWLMNLNSCFLFIDGNPVGDGGLKKVLLNRHVAKMSFKRCGLTSAMKPILLLEGFAADFIDSMLKNNF